MKDWKTLKAIYRNTRGIIELQHSVFGNYYWTIFYPYRGFLLLPNSYSMTLVDSETAFYILRRCLKNDSDWMRNDA